MIAIPIMNTRHTMAAPFIHLASQGQEFVHKFFFAKFAFCAILFEMNSEGHRTGLLMSVEALIPAGSVLVLHHRRTSR